MKQQGSNVSATLNFIYNFSETSNPREIVRSS